MMNECKKCHVYLENNFMLLLHQAIQYNKTFQCLQVFIVLERHTQKTNSNSKGFHFLPDDCCFAKNSMKSGVAV